MSICANCSKEIPGSASSCPFCGSPQSDQYSGPAPHPAAQLPIQGGARPQGPDPGKDAPSISSAVLLLLCFFVGNLGIHRFVTGKIVSGVFMILTLGGLGFWTIVDFFLIFFGKFNDKNGVPIKRDRNGAIVGIVVFGLAGLFVLLAVAALIIAEPQPAG